MAVKKVECGRALLIVLRSAIFSSSARCIVWSRPKDLADPKSLFCVAQCGAGVRRILGQSLRFEFSVSIQFSAAVTARVCTAHYQFPSSVASGRNKTC